MTFTLFFKLARTSDAVLYSVVLGLEFFWRGKRNFVSPGCSMFFYICSAGSVCSILLHPNKTGTRKRLSLIFFFGG